MNNLQKKIYSHPSFNELKTLLQKNSNCQLQHISGSFRAFVASFLSNKLNRPVLYIANDLDSAERIYDDLRLISGDASQVSFLPAIEFEPYDHSQPSPSQLSLRIEAVLAFIESDVWIVVTTPAGLISSFPVPEEFVDRQLYLKVGREILFEELVQQLHQAGLRREEMVEKVGDFSVRGGIIDLFVWDYEDPLRIEFFGNEIESIRRFDVFSQRSIDQLNEITILPNLFRENLKKTFITNFLPTDTLLFAEDSEVLFQKVTSLTDLARTKYAAHLTEGIEEIPPEEAYLSLDNVGSLFRDHLVCKTDLVQDSLYFNVDFNIQPHPDFNGSVKLFLQFLNKLSESDETPTVIIQALNKTQADRLEEIIEEEEIVFNGSFAPEALHNGFLAPGLNLYVLTDHEIFHRFKRRKTYKRFKNGEYLRQLSLLSLYDYVVHIDYGIGQYLGMEMLNLGPVKKECIKIAYQDGDNLFVTVDNLSRVQKFSSEESIVPKLTKLGSTEWERAKKKTKESLKKIAAELIQLYAGRKA
ncbi:hypothetical protein KAR10_09675, partial [bacterium]|nr:hypothetical protein [bacterium]